MKRILLLIAILSLIGCVSIFPPTQQETVTVTLNINDGIQVETHSVDLLIGSTAYEAFDAIAELKSTDYPPYGRMVDSINGIGEDTEDGKYWQYYVDGELAPVGVDFFEIDKQMILEFRYETPPENW